LTEAGILRVGERRGCGLGIIRTGRKPRATVQERYRQQDGPIAGALAPDASAVYRRSLELEHAVIRQ